MKRCVLYIIKESPSNIFLMEYSSWYSKGLSTIFTPCRLKILFSSRPSGIQSSLALSVAKYTIISLSINSLFPENSSCITFPSITSETIQQAHIEMPCMRCLILAVFNQHRKEKIIGDDWKENLSSYILSFCDHSHWLFIVKFEALSLHWSVEDNENWRHLNGNKLFNDAFTIRETDEE